MTSKAAGETFPKIRGSDPPARPVRLPPYLALLTILRLPPHVRRRSGARLPPSLPHLSSATLTAGACRPGTRKRTSRPRRIIRTRPRIKAKARRRTRPKPRPSPPVNQPRTPHPPHSASSATGVAHRPSPARLSSATTTAGACPRAASRAGGRRTLARSLRATTAIGDDPRASSGSRGSTACGRTRWTRRTRTGRTRASRRWPWTTICAPLWRALKAGGGRMEYPRAHGECQYPRVRLRIEEHRICRCRRIRLHAFMTTRASECVVISV
ncbi:hypothetical protein C2E23DRAFT_258127 [Lenzites betulinus]|nr:hypothetical protein C2E23DRAFT_258127 [Lenzites betulinus]